MTIRPRVIFLCGLGALVAAAALWRWSVVSGRAPAVTTVAEPPPAALKINIDRRPRRASGHWAYNPPVPEALPAIPNPDWARNAIDILVAAELFKQGGSPAPEAERPSLIRRVSFDLTGLPPTPREVAEFVADAAPDAYERVVDRLLGSPAYGEHWGRYWLDLARYADSNGYHRDLQRSIWMYRDWVIKAINQNMPFDRFTIEQLAADLLPQPTREQLVATGFHRNTMFNQEGGADPEEFRFKAVVDRVSTTATVWLGTSFACAHCHDHPHDPFSQQEFFELLAFFNSTSDTGADRYGLPVPILYFPTPEETQALDELSTRINQRNKELSQHSHPEAAAADPELNKLAEARANLQSRLTGTLVLHECEAPRPTFVHMHGDPHQPGLQVEPDVPSVLNAFRPEWPRNRLGLALWLTDPVNPLTARVTVNRFWARIFGRGLVATLDDFGTMGESATHPQLLDRLATEFVRSGWNVKALHRLLVTSATYRQAAQVTPQKLELDAANRLLSRGPRFRMEAEMLRDNLLAISGLLDRTIGGPSVFPPQPAGVWDSVTPDFDKPEVWAESTGGSAHRRGMYTYWRRSMPYPAFTLFDAPSREICVARRQRTNTPLQALAMLNEPVAREAAAGLARRMMEECPGEVRDKAAYGFRLCLAREPVPRELNELASLYHAEYDAMTVELAAAAVFGDGTPVHTTATDPFALQQRAWRLVASVLLNLDATLVK